MNFIKKPFFQKRPRLSNNLNHIRIAFAHIKSDKIGQSWLLPPDIRDLIPVDHICYLVVAIVNRIV